MAIIYSYPQVPSIENSDLLIATRFENEERGFARTVSFSADTLGSYIVANHSNTLDQVLNTGNTSLEDAKIGSIYLYNSFEPAILGYTSITGDKNSFNFYSVQGDKYAQISNGQVFIKGIGTTYGVNIAAPTTATAYRQATFQDASGTIAYLSDITTPSTYGLAAFTTNCIPVSNSTVETTLLNGSFEGTLTLPADSLVVGDSFKLNLAGLVTSVSSNSLAISIKTTDGVILAEVENLSFGPSVTNVIWSLDAAMTVRVIGEAGTAQIATFATFNNNFFSPSPIFRAVNSTTFDTTVDNTLVVTAKWNTAAADSFIYTQICTLNKIY